MDEQKLACASIAATVALIAVAIAAVMIVKPAEAVEIEPDWTWRVSPKDTTNTRALTELRLQQLGDKLKCIGETETARLEAEQAALEAEQAAYYVDNSGAYYGGGIYYAPYSDAYNVDGPSHTMPGWYEGYLETYYNASSHYLASTWTLDSEGFYHDENGRYVVGVEISHADEMPYGTVVQTGKGEGVVYDYGSGAEVHDFATNW